MFALPLRERMMTNGRVTLRMRNITCTRGKNAQCARRGFLAHRLGGIQLFCATDFIIIIISLFIMGYWRQHEKQSNYIVEIHKPQLENTDLAVALFSNNRINYCWE